MFEDIENIKLIDIHSGISSQHSVYRDRFSHAFIFKLTGTSEYDFGGRVLTLEAGGMLYIPKRASYEVRQKSQGESRYVLINFDGEMSNAVPKLCAVEGFADVGAACNSLPDLWIFGGAAEHFKCWSVFYNLLSHLATLEQMQYAYTQQAHVIRPAINYLKENLFDPTLKIGRLHMICDVSDTYFRRIFKANFGVKPQEYVTNKRLEQAAAVLGSGEFSSVNQVALEVGYGDALYFSRVFARRYGVCPTQYGKRHRKVNE